MYQNEKEEATRLQGVRKLRQDEEIAWAPPRNMTKWPDWEEARKLENGEWRLEPEEKRKCQKSLSVETKFSRREREMLNEGEEI